MKKQWILGTLGIAALAVILIIIGVRGAWADVPAALTAKPVHTSAATLVVTSAADSGPSTLRQALLDAQASITTPISLASDGTQNDHISGDRGVRIGVARRYAPAQSYADTLVALDPGGVPDTFVHDQHSVAPASATDFAWGGTHGLYGGVVTHLAVSPSGTIFAGTYGAGVFRSTDNGQSWTQAHYSSSLNYVNALAINSSSHIFVGSWGLLRSTDNGETWASTGLANTSVTAVAINSSGHVFAGTFGQGILRSADNGETWTQVNNGLPAPGYWVSDIAINSSDHLFVATDQGIFRSTDNGENWTEVNNGLTNTNVDSLAINSPGHIFAGTWGNEGIFRSTDNGETWTQINNGLTNLTVPSLAINPSDDVFAGTWRGGIFRSTDDGETWENVGLDNTAIRALAINSSGHVFAGSDGEGVFRSEDGGGNWAQINNGFRNAWVRALAASSSGHAFAATWNNGIFRSTDNGVNWTSVGLTKKVLDAIAVNSSGHIFAGTGDIFRSTDGGQTWTQITSGLTNLVQSIAISPSDIIFAGTQNGVFRSTDNGETWTQVGLTSTNVSALAINSMGHIFAGAWSDTGGVFRSTDNGDTWVNVGSISKPIRSLAINSSGHIFAGTWDGVFRSTDNGETWINVGLANKDCYSLAIDLSGRIFVGTLGEGVFLSTDNGGTWTQINNGLKNLEVLALVINSSDRILAGTHGGVFQSTTICTVTSPADSGPGTLRQALLDAGNGDTITFDAAVFPPASPATIALASALPDISQGNLTIEGSNAGVILEGSGTPAGTSGLRITSNGNVIRGLQIIHFPGDGVQISGGAQNNAIGGDRMVGSGPMGQGNLISGNGILGGVTIGGSGTMSNTVTGNYIGTDVYGTMSLANAMHGVAIVDGAKYNRIGGGIPGERNLISANGCIGVALDGAGTDENVVSGNYIGVDATGLSALGNGCLGAAISGGPQNNTIGGSLPGEGNLISGNGGTGVLIYLGGTMGNTVIGNYIGTDSSGSATISNMGAGISIDGGAKYNVIGGANLGKRNLISGNHAGGLTIGGIGSSGNMVQGNFIGTDATGTSPLPNGASAWGVFIFGGATDNVIGGSSPGEANVISGNDYAGIEINGPDTKRNVIRGNYVGTDATGSIALGNREKGVFIHAGAQDNLIGGTTPGERNIISGNRGNGVQVEASSDHNVVSGNYIGVDASGANALPNQGSGVSIWGASYNVIGGATLGERNVISGNDGQGVNINGSGTVSNTVSGNLIGTDASGMIALGNELCGVTISDGAAYNVIGGDTAGERNLVSGNRGGQPNPTCGAGIAINGAYFNRVIGNFVGTDISGAADLGNLVRGVEFVIGAQGNTLENNVISGNDWEGFSIWGDNAASNTIIGNLIGTDVSGTMPLGNATAGIYLRGAASRNRIGGSGPGEGNLIAYNAGPGVSVRDSDDVENTITRNSIHSNAGLGIDNWWGGNTELPPPVITHLTGSDTVSGIACADCMVEVFSDDEDEGRTYEGSATADSIGHWTLNAGHAFSGPNLTATATDPAGNTSEFSTPVSLIDTTPPVVSDVSANPLQLDPGEDVTITAYVLDPVNGVAIVTATLRSRTGDFADTFNLYDDGAHGDGAAGDDLYGNRWTTPVEPRDYMVDVAAEDNEGYRADYTDQISFTTAPLPPMPSGRWDSWSNANSVSDLAFQGNMLWAATPGGVVRWDTTVGGYTKYTVAEGLADNATQTIAVDQNGQIWVGSDATSLLSLWDGSYWRQDERVSWAERINDIAVDVANQIWLATSDGVVILSGEVITTYTTANSGLVADWVQAVAIDDAGSKWFGTYAGVSQLAPDGSWTTYDTGNSGLASDGIASIGIDANGNKWFGTYGGGVSSLAVDGTWTTYNTSNSGLTADYVCAIAFDSLGNTWFGTYAGVSVFDGIDWTTFDTSNSSLANDVVLAIAVDEADNIWFGTYGGGISKLQTGSWSSSLERPPSTTIASLSPVPQGPWKEMAEPRHLASGRLPDMLPLRRTSQRAQSGTYSVAAGTWATYRTDDLFSLDWVNAVAVDQTGRPWFGGWPGVAILSDTQWITLTTANSGILNDDIRDIAFDHSGQPWFAHHGGVSFLSSTGWVTYTQADLGWGDASVDFTSVAVDQENRPWFTLWWGYGVAVLSGTQWITYTTQNSGLGNDYVYDVAVSPANVKWFAAYNMGVSRFDGTTWTNYTSADGVLIRTSHVTVEPNGRAWFSSWNGNVMVIDDRGTADKADDIIAIYTPDDGLAHEQVNAMAVDGSGRKWFGTAGYGLSVLEDRGTWSKADDRWATFTTADGLASNRVSAIAIDDTRGQRWFGTLGGVSRLRETEPIISEVRTTNVRDTSLTVSWITNINTEGEVHYGTDPANLDQTAYDDRGAETFDDTHYVTLEGLLPNTTYYFDDVSGSTTDDNGGAHYSVTTGPTLGLPASDTIYGQVFQEDETTPAEGTIVYITLMDHDGSGSPDEAAPLSALVDGTGYWNANLGNARLADLSAYFTYSASGDQVKLEAQGAADGTGCLLVDTADDSPAADLILNVSTCVIEAPIPLQIGWNHISLPLDPVTPYTAEGVCDEIISQGGDMAEIDRWYASGWDGHICGLPFNNFAIELGADYFIKSSAVVTWTIEGYRVTTPVPLDLQIGWNSIGIPHTDAYTAESLCEEINDQCGDSTAVEIDRWYASGWDGHICGLPFNDFNIEIGKGYFVNASDACAVTPSLAATSCPRMIPRESPEGR